MLSVLDLAGVFVAVLLANLVTLAVAGKAAGHFLSKSVVPIPPVSSSGGLPPGARPGEPESTGADLDLE